MQQLSEQQLNLKIESFLAERMAAHPELRKTDMPVMAQSTRQKVVSRVKKFTNRFAVQPTNKTMYQM